MSAKVILHPTREKSLLRRHPWVFSKAIDQVKGRVKPGDTVDVYSADQTWLGRGAYSPESQIRVRIWTFDPAQSIDNVFFTQRLQTALQARQHVIAQANTNAFRLVAAESDGLPGITIDKYADVLVLQLLSAGAEKHRDKLIWSLNKLFPEHRIYERSDVTVREKEGLALQAGPIQGVVDTPVVITENDVNISVDIVNGHKTGFYLDQRDNRLLAAQYMQDANVLNCFCYTGTFASYALKYGAKHVTNVDVSQTALTTAKTNIEINQLDSDAVTMMQADVFVALREMAEQGRQFDHVVLDPPKFVDSKRTLDRAARGYKDINLYGLKCVKPGGYLSTFSCSGLMSAELFQKIVADAALDAQREVRIIKRYSQASDHPVGSAYPEGYYLKGLLCQVF
ncbi:MAG: class I SAM-dependent methyltransferase [Glaciecola sp.]|jgi:23S rRNA (cytosine1962-C5)-methyltransferase